MRSLKIWTLLYCTSTLVPSRNVKHCVTPKWQEICIIKYIHIYIYVSIFTSYTRQKKLPNRLGSLVFKNAWGTQPAWFHRQNCSQVSSNNWEPLASSGHIKNWPGAREFPKRLTDLTGGLPSEHGSMVCVSDFCLQRPRSRIMRPPTSHSPALKWQLPHRYWP